ncbi:MAG: hypothetical protein BAJALOKI2v1_90024 [Promethearchaeota archaeon]|nr:MAG: hypothetical protein BAJALOKI2v1_90024 [Candidatus Lokiarchaeota archaeon]
MKYSLFYINFAKRTKLAAKDFLNIKFQPNLTIDKFLRLSEKMHY